MFCIGSPSLSHFSLSPAPYSGPAPLWRRREEGAVRAGLLRTPFRVQSVYMGSRRGKDCEDKVIKGSANDLC